MQLLQVILFLFLFSFPIVMSSDLYSSLLNREFFPHSLRGLGLEALRYNVRSLGKYHPSPFLFDPECITVIGTNTFLEHSCTLPAKCGNVKKWVQPEGYFGNEVIVCYSFHPVVSHTYIEFFYLDFTSTLISYSTDDQRLVLSELVPTDFFEHFIIALKPLPYILPKICLESYTTVGNKLPDSVTLTLADDVVTITHSAYNNTLCDPYYIDSIDSFVRTFDYPIAYFGCSYSPSLHEKFYNQDPFVSDYDHFHSLFSRYPYIYSVKRRYGEPDLVFVSYGRLSDLQRFKSYDYFNNTHKSNAHLIYYNLGNYSAETNIYSLSVSFIYRSPFTILIDHLKNFFEYIFHKLLYLIEDELVQISKLFVKLFIEIFRYITSDLIIQTFGDMFYTYLIIYIMFYFYFSDLFKSLVWFLIIMFFFFSFGF